MSPGSPRLVLSSPSREDCTRSNTEKIAGEIEIKERRPISASEIARGVVGELESLAAVRPSPKPNNKRPIAKTTGTERSGCPVLVSRVLLTTLMGTHELLEDRVPLSSPELTNDKLQIVRRRFSGSISSGGSGGSSSSSSSNFTTVTSSDCTRKHYVTKY